MNTNALLITSNNGSLFEIPSLVDKWNAELGKLVTLHNPGLIAVHLQELGGKDWKRDMNKVDKSREDLLKADYLCEYTRSVWYFDKNFANGETFTALGSVYMFHKSLPEIKIYNLKTKSFDVIAMGTHEMYDNIHISPYCHVIRFPNEFFPQCPNWTRKGFIYTRWTIGGKPLELINIHIFHDADNRISLKESPSLYSYNRKKALEHSLKVFSQISPFECPSFVFGDFNFRQDQCLVMSHLLENGFVPAGEHSEESVQLEHPNGDYLKVQVKKFLLKCEALTSNGFMNMRKFDTEFASFKDVLFELPIKFSPSYPLSEDPEKPDIYNETRAPSWCDRILMNKLAHDTITKEAKDSQYFRAGNGVCLGDHKPICLTFNLADVLK
ncbi:Type I inositol 1,4,5-trisphosphate 5-phosphatase isoform X1 [Oopsacas minuta]|uniref:inositol-polyphosphate 5-phosphatase n=1 Tax=Oopsacas minuta TaxID=111878 RepID=A0AAV7K9U1_9METZ|nr:Type I inositol 1,4,5-trisphosphate 5-phosphatase isoform X1 [Oopsacas minuta]